MTTLPRTGHAPRRLGSLRDVAGGLARHGWPRVLIEFGGGVALQPPVLLP